MVRSVLRTLQVVHATDTHFLHSGQSVHQRLEGRCQRPPANRQPSIQRNQPAHIPLRHAAQPHFPNRRQAFPRRPPRLRLPAQARQRDSVRCDRRQHQPRTDRRRALQLDPRRPVPQEQPRRLLLRKLDGSRGRPSSHRPPVARSRQCGPALEGRGAEGAECRREFRE